MADNMPFDDGDRKMHWEQVHQNTAPEQRSWFQPQPFASLELIEAAGIAPTARVIDVGGGTSRLVDHLLRRGFDHLTVLDVAPSALDEARARLGVNAERVTWLEADVTRAAFDRTFDFWHDRAVFHFLIHSQERRTYVDRLHDAVVPGGHALIATFALDGPPTCSRLPVMRHTPTTLQYALGPEFHLLETRTEMHRTPSGKSQSFVYCLFQRSPQGAHE